MSDLSSCLTGGWETREAVPVGRHSWVSFRDALTHVLVVAGSRWLLAAYLTFVPGAPTSDRLACWDGGSSTIGRRARGSAVFVQLELG